MVQAIMPGLAIWPMPLMPNMSPAAMGWTIVRLRGAFSLSKRAPMAARMASGQLSPEEEFTATMASSGMMRTASAAVTILGISHLLPRIMSAAFSAIAIVGALVLEETTCGMMELVADTKPFNAVDAARKINHGHVIDTQLAGSHGMIGRAGIAARHINIVLFGFAM